jgi:RNA polymerase sigma factor (sigma-70 family)
LEPPSSNYCQSHPLNKTKANIIPEEELVSRLKAKDKKAFEYLYDNYSAELFGIINHILNNHEVAEDALQETFIKVWNNMLSYDKNKGRLFTWLLNIARNTALDKLKSKHLKYQLQSVEKNVHAINSIQSTKQNIEHIGIKQNVNALKEDQKQIIEMAYYGGYTQEEIAKELGIPLGTVKTKMRSAITELRKVFGNEN